MITADLNQSILKGGQRMALSILRRTLKAVERALDLRRPYEVSIAFVAPREMRRLNRERRGKDRVTDVLSFALDDHTGELLLCYDQARRQAIDLGHSVRDELCFLIVHGLLHLFGHDHERPSDRKIMFALQTKILTSLGIDPRV